MEELAKYEVHPPEPPGRPPTQVTFSSKKPARSVIDDAPPKISAGQSVDLWQPGDDVID
jgi:hypothetical protein